MKPLLFTNVRLIDPKSGLDKLGRLLVKEGKIAAVDLPETEKPPEECELIDGQGAVLCPGLVDMRVTVGEPGYEYRETIATAAEASAAGGITTMAILPNSKPAIDNPALVTLLKAKGEETHSVNILPYGALSVGCEGKEMAEIGLLHEAGAIAFTDGNKALENTRLMMLTMAYARGYNCLVVQHPEDPSLARNGSATRGELATKLGLPSIPAAAEAIMIARDLRLAELTGCRLHFGHISTAEGLELIRQAKAKGLPISCDTAPVYFDLNEEAIGDFRTYAKLSPPLRSEEDRQAVCQALADGTIDAIASDHLPRDVDDKRLPFAEAAAGGTGLVTLLSVTLLRVKEGNLSLSDALSLLTYRPAALLDQHFGTLNIGADADLCLFDPDQTWLVEAGKLPGRAQNTPFDNRELPGIVLGTWKSGRRVYTRQSS
ncbi:Dihydroorotase or related cyclic amidohydrolase (AllB) (PDB:1J79) [Commensalibacter communis]|uniref:dihydroorotase n=1 Tax=Commensalibacter communis TaxID=2972786 RepID=UPI0022FF9B4C|nr:dihydroorotase [Commensalibacter communis]CAI3926945.1 Dihydroorotase or related cyclic amidohydrolase (AllB) (PDB:1J79) [Commensalibacter communis]